MKRKLTQLKTALRNKRQEFDTQDSKLNDEDSATINGEIALASAASSSEEQSSEDDEKVNQNDIPKDEKKDSVEHKTLSKMSRRERDAEILRQRSRREEEKRNLVPYTNKQRVLVFSSRGVTSRFRHLTEDFRLLLPHSKKENKHDTKRNLYEINDLCEMKYCNNCIFFEARKSKDLYMWVAKAPAGPSAKFLVTNIHTMEELRLTGNCLKGSRPILSFDKEFESTPEYQLVKEIFVQVFGTPNGFPKSKPFIDHIINFSILDGRIWFRHFQITDNTQDKKEIKKAQKLGEETVKLVEIGPRFVMKLIKIFSGSFGGEPIYENPRYLSPNKQRGAQDKAKGDRYVKRKLMQKMKASRHDKNKLPKDPLVDVFK